MSFSAQNLPKGFPWNHLRGMPPPNKLWQGNTIFQGTGSQHKTYVDQEQSDVWETWSGTKYFVILPQSAAVKARIEEAFSDRKT